MKMRYQTSKLVFFALLVTGTLSAFAWQRSYVPKEGMVPDQTTAISIAEAVLIPIYGRSLIEGEEPLLATLEGDVWTVKGHLPAGHNVGGVAIITISKTDARIISVIHGK